MPETQKIEVNDSLGSDELLLLDLGQSAEDIYNELDSIKLSSEDPGVLDPSYYRERLNDIRIHMGTIARVFTRVLRARTAAQTRLTSRETRYEIQVDNRLEHNDHVRGGVSSDDRKARAANALVDLRNAIRSSKNEVESLKNMEKAIGVFNKTLNTISGDIRQQSRLVEIELQHLNRVIPGKTTSVIDNLAKNPAHPLYGKNLANVELQHGMVPVEVSESTGDSVENLSFDDEVAAGTDAMMAALGQASVEMGVPVVSLPESTTPSEMGGLHTNAPLVDASQVEPSSDVTDLLSSLGVEVTPISGDQPQSIELTMDFDIPLEFGDALAATPAEPEKASPKEESDSSEEPADVSEGELVFDEGFDFDTDSVAPEAAPESPKVTSSFDAGDDVQSDDSDEMAFEDDVLSLPSMQVDEDSVSDDVAPVIPGFGEEVGASLPIASSGEVPQSQGFASSDASTGELLSDEFAVSFTAEVPPSVSDVFASEQLKSFADRAQQTGAEMTVSEQSWETPVDMATEPVVEPVVDTPAPVEASAKKEYDMDDLFATLGLD